MSVAPITVFARRDVKGARRRELATQLVYADGTTGSSGIAYLPPGGVDVYFKTADGMAHVFLPPHVVELIRRGPTTTAPQVVPPLVKS